MAGRRLRFEEYEVDLARYELRKNGVRLRIERKPFRVLELLLRDPGELVTREELCSFLWPDAHVSFAHGLNTAVNSLRQVLGETSRESHFIETRPGSGYRFAAAVKEVMESRANGMAWRADGKNPDAYEDCLKGRHLLDKMDEDEVYKAIAYFKSAAMDGEYASLAHAGMADAYCQLASLGVVSLAQVDGPARVSAEAALKKDPELAEAHVSDGRVKMLFDWDWKGAQEAVDRALTLDNGLVAAHALHASLLSTLGSHEDAVEACRQALTRDPLSYPANLQLASCLYAARDFKGAIDQCWKMLTLTSCLVPAQVQLASCYEQLGLNEEAVVEFQNAKRCAGFNAAAVGGLGQVCAKAGQVSEAEQAFVELASEAQNRYVSSYWFALLCAGRSETSRALAYLQESLRERDPALLWLKADARFDAMRGDERFQAMLGELGGRN